MAAISFQKGQQFCTPCLQLGPDYVRSCVPQQLPNQLLILLMLRWFDLVIVLQTDNTLLYDRLDKR